MPWDSRTGGGSASRSYPQFEQILLDYTDAKVATVAGLVVPVPAASGDATGAADTAALTAAIATAKSISSSSGVPAVVLAKAGQVYQVVASGSTSVQLPLGGRASYNYALRLPSNVTLDMNGSTLQLRGSGECELVMNESVLGVGGVLSAGLSTGGAITSLSCNALGIAIPSGSQLVMSTVGANGKRQVFTTSVIANVGATSISILSTTPTFAFPAGVGFVVRDQNIGLRNAVLDLNHVVFTGHVGLNMAYIDGLTMYRVMMKNGIRGLGWLFDITNGDFDFVGSDGMQGEGWAIGDPSPTGFNHNGIYDSRFGHIYGRNITLLDTVSQPGNSFDMILYNCSIDSIHSTNTSGGFKLQQPSTDVTIGTALLDTVGEASALQGGFKLQGDASYAAGTDMPKRINVGQVVVRNCVNVGLYMYHTEDCAVQSYVGYKNVGYHDAFSDVVIAGGINPFVGRARSILSGGGGVQITADNGGAGPLRFRVGSVNVSNPGQNFATLTSALSTGAAITALPVSALTFPIASGHSVILADGAGHLQTFTTSGAVAVGATSIPVASLTPTFAFPIGTKAKIALINSGVRMDITCTGSFGEIVCLDDQAIHTMDRGLNEGFTTSSVVSIEKFSSTGHNDVPFARTSAGVGILNFADTSGATLANLEIEVNKLKAALRTYGVLI